MKPKSEIAAAQEREGREESDQVVVFGPRLVLKLAHQLKKLLGFAAAVLRPADIKELSRLQNAGRPACLDESVGKLPEDAGVGVPFRVISGAVHEVRRRHPYLCGGARKGKTLREQLRAKESAAVTTEAT